MHLANHAAIVKNPLFSIDYLQLTSHLQDEIELKLNFISKFIQ